MKPLLARVRYEREYTGNTLDELLNQVEEGWTSFVVLPVKCEHDDWQYNTTGGLNFGGGEIGDNIKESLVCSICGAETDQLETTEEWNDDII